MNRKEITKKFNKTEYGNRLTNSLIRMSIISIVILILVIILHEIVPLENLSENEKLLFKMIDILPITFLITTMYIEGYYEGSVSQFGLSLIKEKDLKKKMEVKNK